MICPVCKTNNPGHAEHGQVEPEFCVQCGADLQMHRLLHKFREEAQLLQSKPAPELALNIPKSGVPTSQMAKTTKIWQFAPVILGLICTGFIIFVGLQFLVFLERIESQRSSLSSKWSETGYEQLQQMNATIKQELDLILEQRRENQALQAKLNELTSAALKTTETPRAAARLQALPVPALPASGPQGQH